MAWLGWWQGGADPRHWGVVALAVLMWAAIAAVYGRLPRLSTPAGIGVLAGALLALWTGASIVWATPSRHLAIEEATRTTMYAAALAIGALLLASPSALGRAARWTATGLVALAAVTVVRLLGEPSAIEHFVAGRLAWPVGYPNGIAAAYALGAWLLIGQWCSTLQQHQPDSTPHQRRERATVAAVMLTGAALLLTLAASAQSRGGIVAFAGAACVAFVLVPTRAALVIALVVTGGAALAAGPRFERVFETARELADATFTRGGDLQAAQAAAEIAGTQAGMAVAIVTAASLLLALSAAFVLLAWHDRRGLARWQQRWQAAPRLDARHFLAGAALILGCVLTLAVASSEGRGWIRSQWAGCRDPGAYNQPRQQPGSSHLEQVGTNRCDFWRVALENWRDHPAAGVGAGNFGGWYALRRQSPELPTYAHSLPLQLLGELGIVGALLGAGAAGAGAWATWRFARSGPGRDASTAAIAAGLAGWAAHAGIDWLWQLPVVTLPAIVLLGGLLGASSMPHQTTAGWRPRAAIAIPALGLLVIAGIVTAGLAAADQLVRDGQPGSASTTRKDLRLAARLAPAWPEPHLRLAANHARAGRREAVRRSVERAVQLEPESWQVLERGARLLARTAPQRAAELRAQAAERNPRARSRLQDR